MELSFWVNVYGTSLGYTMRFGSVRQSLVGLSGVFVGIGEISGQCRVLYIYINSLLHSIID